MICPITTRNVFIWSMCNLFDWLPSHPSPNWLSIFFSLSYCYGPYHVALVLMSVHRLLTCGQLIILDTNISPCMKPNYRALSVFIFPCLFFPPNLLIITTYLALSPLISLASFPHQHSHYHVIFQFFLLLNCAPPSELWIAFFWCGPPIIFVIWCTTGKFSHVVRTLGSLL